MRTRVWWLWLGVVVAIGSGCGDPDPDEVVYLYGPIVAPDGSPRPHAPVNLERSSDCKLLSGSLYEESPATWWPYGSQQANAEGSFVFPLRISEVSPRFNPDQHSEFCFRISTGGRTDGSRASVSFFHNQQDMPLGPLIDWNTTIDLEPDPAGLRMHAVHPPPGLPDVTTMDTGAANPPVPMQLSFWTVATDGGVVFRYPADTMALEPVDAVVSPYVAEDFWPLEARLTTRGQGYHQQTASMVLPVPGYAFEARLVSSPAAIAVPGAPLVPISRGAPCELAPTDVRQDCPYTDGRLTEVAVYPGADPSAYSGYGRLTIRLDAPHTLRHVVIRGLDAHGGGLDVTLTLEGSLDQGLTWFPILSTQIESSTGDLRKQGLFGSADYDLPVDPPVAAAWVRLSGETLTNWGPGGPPPTSTPMIIYSLGEVSLFE